MKKLNPDDTKTIDYLRAHLEQGWSIGYFYKYLPKKQHNYFKQVICKRPEFANLIRIYKKKIPTLYGKLTK
jgi:hypothetical protein